MWAWVLNSGSPLLSVHVTHVWCTVDIVDMGVGICVSIHVCIRVRVRVSICVSIRVGICVCVNVRGSVSIRVSIRRSHLPSGCLLLLVIDLVFMHL